MWRHLELQIGFILVLQLDQPHVFYYPVTLPKEIFHLQSSSSNYLSSVIVWYCGADQCSSCYSGECRGQYAVIPPLLESSKLQSGNNYPCS
jgi:hypothetical protein